MTIAVRMLLMLALTTMAWPAAAQAPAQPAAAEAGPAYVVTFVETGAPLAGKVAASLRRLAAASRKENGNAGFIVLRERARPGRFAVLETWRDKAALEAHDAAAKAAEDKMQPLLVSPSDRRPCVGLDIAAAEAGSAAAGGVYVLTHVDVIPPKKDEAVAVVKELVAASRKDTGVVRFDALTQGNRPNHMFLVEVWHDRTAHDAHVMADHTRAFRTKLSPLQGALYDERLYEVVR